MITPTCHQGLDVPGGHDAQSHPATPRLLEGDVEGSHGTGRSVDANDDWFGRCRPGRKLVRCHTARMRPGGHRWEGRRVVIGGTFDPIPRVVCEQTMASWSTTRNVFDKLAV